MIPEFLQKALVKDEKSRDILVKDEKLRLDISTGSEISSDKLKRIFDKGLLKRKDFSRLEEIIKDDLDKKIEQTDDKVLLFDLISEDFKRYDIQTIKSKLTKREYLYITGKTLYEHFINQKDSELEIIKKNRLLFFLNIPHKEWNNIDNLKFEKYFRIPSILSFAVFFKRNENKVSKACLNFKDSLENSELTLYDNNLLLKTTFKGSISNLQDLLRFDLTEEKYNYPATVYFPREIYNISKGYILILDNPSFGTCSSEAVFIKAVDFVHAQSIIGDYNYISKAGNWFNHIPSNSKIGVIDEESWENKRVMNILGQITGKYTCYTIGKDKDRIRSQKVIINSDCTVNFSSSTLNSDIGYAKFSDSDKILQIHFHFELDEFKYTFLMQLNNSDIREGKMQGVVCGINRLNEPFAERAYLIKSFDSEPEPDEFKIGDEKLAILFEKVPELLPIFLGIENDFSADFKSLNIFYQNFYLPRQQHIDRISGIFEVFSFDPYRELIRKSIIQIKKDGYVDIKSAEKGQYYHGKASIINSDILIINNYKGTDPDHLTGTTFTLIDGFDISEIHHILAFYTGKNNKNELVTYRQVMFKTMLPFETVDSLNIPIHSNDFVELNAKYNKLGNYLVGKTNNQLTIELPIDPNLKPEADFGLIYFESACYVASSTDRTRSLQQLEKAFSHGFRNKNLLLQEVENGSLRNYKESIDLENLRIIN